jgi:hypothetical protein
MLKQSIQFPKSRRKRSAPAPVRSALAILAGSMTFMGTAEAVTILSEDFEGGSNVFAAGTYNYAQNYTMPNLLTPGGGLKYFKGGAGINGSVSTNTFTAAPVSLLTGGITAGQIDSGAVICNLYAQFSTYRTQNDYGTLSVQFLDGSSAPIGSPVTIGGEAFVSALGSGNNGSYTDARDWGADSLVGAVPVGARSAEVKILDVKSAGGTAIDGYMDNVKIDIFTGTAPITFVSASPPNNATGVGPGTVVTATLKDGSLPVNNSSIQLLFDSSPVVPTIQKSGNLTTITYDPPGLLPALSAHTYRLIYSSTGVATPNQTNDFQFAVTDWVNLVLPAPVYFEDFNSVSEGSLPAGWTVGNDTVPQTPGIDYRDVTSDAYLNWVVISNDTANFLRTNNAANYGSIFSVRPDVVVNGTQVTNLISGNCILAASAGRLGTDIQVQYLRTPIYTLFGRADIYAVFHSIYIQNQDSIGAVEYSINGGVTWLPALYMLDGPDVLRTASGGIDASNTFATVYTDVGNPATTFPTDGWYGQVIGLGQSLWSAAAPNISPRVNDNTTESKRVEVVRLPFADNQANVQLRFVQSGSASWFFALDDVGLYSMSSVARPTIGPVTPASQTIAVGNSGATFSISAIGAMPLSYQWRTNGVNIPGRTNDSLPLPANIQFSDAGSFDVVVSTPGSSVTSSPPATVTVIDAVIAPVTGQWDFNLGNLQATCGQDLRYFNASVTTSTFFDSTINFGISAIAGQAANVMHFIPTSGNSGVPGSNPTTDAWGGYKMYHGVAPNGGGTNVNQYTLIMDVLYPLAVDDSWRALLQASTNATTGGDDSEFYLSDGNGIGISSIYQGVVTAGDWHRIAVAVDLSGPGTHPVVTKFIDGVKVGEQTGGLSATDGRFSLNPLYALLFAENNGYNNEAYVSSVQFRNGRLSDAAIAAMGGPTASKIPGAICANAQGANVVIHWSGTTLKSADSLAGPWTTIVGAAKPYIATGPLADKKFYRSY